MSQNNFFVKFMRSETSLELLRDPKAFTLMAQIAFRARNTNGVTKSHSGTDIDLEKGQSFIGDLESIGLTPKEYICAKERLEKRKLANFKGTSKGTIATITNTEVFDVTFESARQTKDEQGITNRE